MRAPTRRSGQFWWSSDLLGLDELWDGLAPYPVAPTIPVRHALERALEYNVSWLVRRKSRLGAIDAEAAVFRDAVTRLREAMTAQPPAGRRVRRWAGASTALAELGAPADLLTACRAMPRMQAALALASAATDSGFDVVDLEADLRRGSGETLGLSWLYATIPITLGGPALGPAGQGCAPRRAGRAHRRDRHGRARGGRAGGVDARASGRPDPRRAPRTPDWPAAPTSTSRC